MRMGPCLWVKDQRRENPRKWCRRMGLEEQRLIEMAKLQRQFQDIINTSGGAERNIQTFIRVTLSAGSEGVGGLSCTG